MTTGVGTTTPAAARPIGEKLRTVRLDRRLSLEETAWRTRIRPDLLRAIEEGEFAELGHHAFVRSHLTSYARFLGMDATELVNELEATQTEPLPSAIEELDRQQRSARKPRRPKWLIAALLSASVLAAGAFAGIIGGQAERPTTEPVPAGAPENAGAPAASVPIAQAKVSVSITAAAETRVTVSADGALIFEGLLGAGEAQTFRAREQLEITVSDGGTVSLGFNGGDALPAGPAGTGAHVVFGPDGRA